MKDLIIGGASNYTWDQVAPWVNSIKKSGFTGDIVLVGTNLTKETIDKLVAEHVNVSVHGQLQADGSYRMNSQMPPHIERFFYMWNFLDTHNVDYRYVITTDTRDVIFQKNPSEWLEKNLMAHERLVASSEGMRYINEPWGNKNLQDTFGAFFHEKYKDMMIYNVGTIAGDSFYVKDLLLMIFQLSLNRPTPIVDQAVYNFILNQFPYKAITGFSQNIDGWAVQLGTTPAAVAAGSGDIGANLKPDQIAYEDDVPQFMEGIVLNKHMQEFVIVHQYDRIPALKEKILERYGDH